MGSASVNMFSTNWGSLPHFDKTGTFWEGAPLLRKINNIPAPHPQKINKYIDKKNEKSKYTSTAYTCITYL